MDGSAKAGVNYQGKTGTVTFAPREKHKTVVVDIMDDGQGPGTKFQLVANGPHGGGSHPRDYWVTGRIYDETPTFRSWDESARESGNGRETQMNFYVSLLDFNKPGTYTIDYATVDGTARAGSDYTATSGTFTFAPGDKGWKQVTVPILDDAVDDSGEQFSLVLSNPTGGAQLNRWHHTVKGTILNEDAPGVSGSFPTSTPYVQFPYRRQRLPQGRGGLQRARRHIYQDHTISAGRQRDHHLSRDPHRDRS